MTITTRRESPPARTRSRSDRLVPLGLVLLSLVPVAAGAARVTELASHPEVTAGNARFVASPVPVLVHIVGITLYSLLGAFQFSPAVRRRHPRWHRTAGRVIIPAGIAAAASGLWMTLSYDLPAHDGALLGPLSVMRLLIGSAMIASIVLGLRSVLRRDVARHRAWMMRGYALGMGAGTQVFTNLPWVLLAGEPGAGTRAVLMGAGWGINIAVVEWLIRRSRVPARPRTPATLTGVVGT